MHRQVYGIAEIEVARIFHLEPQIEWRLLEREGVEVVGAHDQEEFILRFIGIGIFDGSVDGSPGERIEGFAGPQLLGPAGNEPGGNTPGFGEDEKRDVKELRGMVGDAGAEGRRLGLSECVAEIGKVELGEGRAFELRIVGLDDGELNSAGRNFRGAWSTWPCAREV